MGRGRSPRPNRLAAKLRELRFKLDLTQEQMFERLGETKTRLYVGHIGEFETGRRVPSLQVVLAYALAAGIPMELIVDDDLDLPDRLPAYAARDWVRKLARRTRR